MRKRRIPFLNHSTMQKSHYKNPAYGRQRISRPMRIVAPIPKNLASKAKFATKKTMRGDLAPFMSKSFTIWDHFFLLLFPKDSKYLKSLDIWIWEVGAKRPLNGVKKCDGQTNKQTNIRKIWTFLNWNIINFAKVDKGGRGGGNAYPLKVDNLLLFLEPCPNKISILFYCLKYSL